MNITKLLALILSFQASVQAVSLQDLYRQYAKEHKTQDAAAIETKLEQLKKWGIDPNTEIRGNLDWTHSLAEKYLFHIVNGNTADAAAIETKLEQLKKWGIDPNTVLHQANDREKTLAKMYAFHIDKGNTEDAADLEKKIAIVKKLGISLHTSILKDLNKTHTFEEKYLCHIVNGNTADAADIEKKIAILKKLGIDLGAYIIKDIKEAYSFAQLFTYHIDTDTEPERCTLESIATLKILDIKLSTPFKFYRYGHRRSESEEAAYCLRTGDLYFKNGRSDYVFEEARTRCELSFNAARELATEEESWLDTFFKVLPEKQERKEELSEMKEEENGSPKRRHPDSKSE